MGLVWKIAGLALLAYLVRHSLIVINVFGYLAPRRHHHQPGPCRAIPGIEYGSEDIQLISDGLAVISAGWETVEANAPEDLRGYYLFDFNQPDKNATKLKMTRGLHVKNLSPHGISIWTDSKTGRVTMFAVNHGATTYDNESIEVFEYHKKTKTLQHLKTIRDPQFKRINDIVATSSNTFYGTNDCIYFHNPLKWKYESYLQTRFGNVVYYDGEQAHVVASGYVLPNGVNISPDGKYLYVAVTGENQLVILQRHEDNSLTEIKRVDLYMTRPDNIDVEPDGNLWISGSWRLLPDEFGWPSMVIRADLRSNQEFAISEVYVDDGRELGGSSIAVYYKNQLLIGTPNNKLLYCQVKPF